MAEEIDDYGFYREDFSAESDWEVFNAQLVELFQKWELSSLSNWGRDFEKGELFTCNWKQEEEIVSIHERKILATYYKADLKYGNLPLNPAVSISECPLHNDLQSTTNSFGPPVSDGKINNLHTLARLYGLRRFVVLHPANNQTHYLTSPDQFNFFLSSISVVAAEVCSTVPIFVQIYDPKWNFFLGVGVTANMRTNFDLVALEQAPNEYCYLSGLLRMFKEKTPSSNEAAKVSVRNTYTLDSIQIRVPMYVPFGMTPVVDEERSIISLSYFTALPHGYLPDSVTDMYAVYTWPEVAENVVIDTHMQTQFVPSKAHHGSIYQVVHARSYLSSCLKDFQNLCTAHNTLESYVGRDFSGSSMPDNPLDQLTKPRMKKILSHKQSKQYLADGGGGGGGSVQQKKISGPMNENELNIMLYYLFPDMHPEFALFPYERQSSQEKIDPHRIKSAEVDSLVYRLSCLLATCHAHFGSKSGLAQLWASFTRELRFLWENCILVQGVTPGLPDIRTCLLHQKLQMLNTCIQRKLETVHPKIESIIISEDDTDEEEFYDCSNDEAEPDDDEIRTKSIVSIKRVREDDLTDDDDEDDDASAKVQAPKPKGRKPMTPDREIKPLGRAHIFNNLKLLDSDEPLYEPITQGAVPKTEDQLQDDADTMFRMGAESEYVAQMMSASLFSDCQAFKSANPKAKFEDFIRWFSPNDWEEYTDTETGERKHKLSPRMLASGNAWEVLWQEAVPMPISRQKRLFNDTNEGFKVLNYLETRNLGQIYGLTIVPLLHSAILKLKNIFSNSNVLELFNQSLDEVLADLSRLSRDVELQSPQKAGGEATMVLPNPEPILRKIKSLERQFYQYKCFEKACGMPSDTEELHKRFKEVLKTNGSFSHIPSLERGGDGSVADLMNFSFQNEMRDRLITKDYVIRMGGPENSNSPTTRSSSSNREESNNNANSAMPAPQFLRAIVTGEKLRLCGAFTENTTFVD